MVIVSLELLDLVDGITIYVSHECEATQTYFAPTEGVHKNKQGK